MKTLSALALLAASAQAVLRRFDDADFSIISYSGNWVHENLDRPLLFDGTQSFTQDPLGSFSFSFTGTAFALCAGLKADRGPFEVSIDGVTAGSGTQFSATQLDDAPECQTVFRVANMANVDHTIVVANANTSFLTIDSITLDLDPEAASSIAAASETTAATTSTTSVSSTSITSSSSSSSSVNTAAIAASRSSVASASRASASSLASASSASASRASASSAAAAAAGSNNASATAAPSSGGSSTGAIAGGVVGGIVALALIAVLAWFCCVRRRRNGGLAESDNGHNPFVSDHDTEENAGDYNKYNVMAEADNAPAASYASPSAQSGSASVAPFIAPLPYPGHSNPASPVARTAYSNQYFPSFPPQPERQNTFAPSRATSFASAVTSPLHATTPPPASTQRMSVPVERDGPLNQPSTMFPTDVDASPQEDAYGGMADDSDGLSGSDHARRPSDIDLIATTGQAKLKRKPPPAA